MKALQDLDIFVRTVDSGSLSATARALDLTPAAASAALKRLEAELGVPLFVRSTRSLRLTQQGERFLTQCRPALEALQQASHELGEGGDTLQGVLRLSAPSDLGRNVLLPWLDEFQQLHPRVDIRLQLSDSIANVYSQPVDAAFRYGEPPDSGLVALPLAAEHRRVLCAAPAYLQAHGAPASPHELAGHACLCFMLNDEVHDRWRFWHGEGPPLTVQVKGVNVSNDGDAVRRWALMGRGIAYKAFFDVAADLAQGRLQPLCTDWTTEATPLYLVMPGRRQLTPLLRSLRDFVAGRTAALAR
ncbi:LysR family transcriptional regulator [Hydrogenophaga laconesensis]|uniref:DNA-binding transcriptional LysR family regulator n=1 Tax=Hydrogenophaga laconesensis TaxID=1805971 RepID=A0ABU1VHK3_9BURK|nr:LysR family transcriptional regulator [Hydrogenophaga laconesensis]MDR7096643.1 DNA-binding transcriptional LysR family regulator [Hydrogenophaga laconesensis]